MNSTAAGNNEVATIFKKILNAGNNAVNNKETEDTLPLYQC